MKIKKLGSSDLQDLERHLWSLLEAYGEIATVKELLDKVYDELDNRKKEDEGTRGTSFDPITKERVR